jgi:hypothetical protein
VDKSGAAEAKQYDLPGSATITICNQDPDPPGKVEVTPDGGRIEFDNQDDKEYRLRLWRTDSDSSKGIDILLSPGDSVTVVIKKNDEFLYSVVNISGDEAANGHGGGPIRN